MRPTGTILCQARVHAACFWNVFRFEEQVLIPVTRGHQRQKIDQHVVIINETLLFSISLTSLLSKLLLLSGFEEVVEINVSIVYDEYMAWQGFVYSVGFFSSSMLASISSTCS